MDNPLGLYEKALPPELPLKEKLAWTGELGFDFMELSVDESEQRMKRLFLSPEETRAMAAIIHESGIRVPTMCFSAHRRCPLGSPDEGTRAKALEMTQRAVELACALGIRVIQLAGYDVYYERGGARTRELYFEGMRRALQIAERYQVTLAVETMDTAFLNSITKYLDLKARLPSPWLKVYPDVGNLTAWGNDVTEELRRGIGEIVAVHIKETLPVEPGSPGRFRDVPFGEGTVDFAACFRTLREIGYAGPFLVEMWAHDGEDARSCIQKARTFVLEQIAS